MTLATMARYGIDIDNPTHVAGVWSTLAEPGDTWAGCLREALGSEEALSWVLSPYTPLVDLEGPGGELPETWKSAWNLWNASAERLSLRTDLRKLEELGGRLVIPGMAEWPEQLNVLGYATPPALWVLGSGLINTPQENTVSVVGSRAATHYGQAVTEGITQDLAQEGTTIVSGGSYGIDASAHRGALRAAEEEGGSALTIAVVCGGFETFYPAGNVSLYERILSQGGNIVAEMRPSARPARWRFLERHRLIAAWSALTLVQEAGVRSSAMAAAERALGLGRKVAAVPGSVLSHTSVGPHELIRAGETTLVTSAEDILQLIR